ncbi:hypothetical protein A1O3_10497 [Capronia epimyces CBS 606.96]|uniref:DUF6590 domain-containing protein n=1 Tax=Capronia epimyces CBS 606.96 TaxID=1182542 RepID=W9X8T2_9EURO|nr:uncharacterized protein A1O3_10497 [Capronia epimyces CBS 606.96]EXJ76852.1 hypothetical protein A1O3_10497 [Capronia epimyces CBS 606.96]
MYLLIGSSDERTPRRAPAPSINPRAPPGVATAAYGIPTFGSQASRPLPTREDSSRNYVVTSTHSAQASRQSGENVPRRSLTSQQGLSPLDYGPYDEDRRQQFTALSTSAYYATRERQFPVRSRQPSDPNVRPRALQPSISEASRQTVTGNLAETNPQGLVTVRPPPQSNVPGGRRPGPARYSVSGDATVSIDDSTLNPLYTVKRSAFYKVGRVFTVLWHENYNDAPRNGQAASRNTYTSENIPVSTGRFGERIYTTPRRMVVVREDHGHCVCIQINTYASRGLKKFGRNNPRDVEAHSIIHMEDSEARWLDDEPQSSKRSIAVQKVRGGQRLDPASRLCYSRPHTVEHTVKSMEVGMVTKESLPYLLGYYQTQNNVT